MREDCWPRPRARLRRHLLTLAIESSCDDSAVAVLEKHGPPQPGRPAVRIRYHEKITSNNLAYKGVHPLEALHSHEENLANLVARAMLHLPKAALRPQPPCPDVVQVHPRSGSDDTCPSLWNVRKPDLVTVTRGPGMRSNLNAGLNLAKGLAVAWNRPLLGVHHMQAHALTPRMVNALEETPDTGSFKPSFPFLSLLVSGGHTLLTLSRGLTDHEQLAGTVDVAIGDAIDKIAREVLPDDVMNSSAGTMYGPALEQFAFPDGPDGRRYDLPATRAAELDRYTSLDGAWSLAPLLAVSRSGSRTNDLAFSFTGLCSSVKRATHQLLKYQRSFLEDQRRELATHAMRLAFEHLASRVWLALKHAPEIRTVVVSGGVASNCYLRQILRTYLGNRGFGHVDLIFPPLHLCVDNAIMIGWAGIEMYEEGWQSELSIRSLKKWSLDSRSEDGGILGASGWRRREESSNTPTSLHHEINE
ncbi:MAG: hypothetical protein Q9162_007531 [Coniocarpon cinnabarinum]